MLWVSAVADCDTGSKGMTMSERGWLVTTVLLCAVLAAPAALPALLEHGRGVPHLGAWASALVCALAGSICLFVSTGFVVRHSIPTWCRCVSAASLAAFGPLAVSSTLYQTWANLALAAAVLAVTVSLTDMALLRWSLGLFMTAAACALDATALVWPIGCLWSVLSYRQSRGYAMALLAAGVGGVFLARLSGWPVLTGYRIQGAPYALHRDVVMLMPVIVLGLVGLTRCREWRRPGPGTQAKSFLLSWAVMGIFALLIAVCGWSMNVRLAVLGLWWLMPVGLAELTQMLASEVSRGSVVRRLGIVSVAVVAALSLVGFRGWCDGLLLMLYLLIERG